MRGVLFIFGFTEYPKVCHKYASLKNFNPFWLRLDTECRQGRSLMLSMDGVCYMQTCITELWSLPYSKIHCMIYVYNILCM